MTVPLKLASPLLHLMLEYEWDRLEAREIIVAQVRVPLPKTQIRNFHSGIRDTGDYQVNITFEPVLNEAYNKTCLARKD